ncbi:putative Anti-sigma-factor antagonist [Candidatus Terasakiella magnetica]|uniref:Putative Anti-sigma-factor antagonist n=1 Tax=Candidatus Terasakiella magnetica TaxID=1867952 RepID=A0A1C3RK56_9PROT|nr:STAS domain-containing protein [Candidatus Terasakiella magnetica]SCA57617.1 putative Anti-sigma-factor antagonist [Candidatus Terasakiella magnetica]
MEYSLLDEGNVKRVAFYGNIKSSSRPKMLEIADAMPQSEKKEWILDVDEFEYIDSSGLGMMLELQEAAQQCGIRLSIRGANNLVKRMFKLSRFDTLFNIID